MAQPRRRYKFAPESDPHAAAIARMRGATQAAQHFGPDGPGRQHILGMAAPMNPNSPEGQAQIHQGESDLQGLEAARVKANLSPEAFQAMLGSLKAGEGQAMAQGGQQGANIYEDQARHQFLAAQAGGAAPDAAAATAPAAATQGAQDQLAQLAQQRHLAQQQQPFRDNVQGAGVYEGRGPRGGGQGLLAQIKMRKRRQHGPVAVGAGLLGQVS